MSRAGEAVSNRTEGARSESLPRAGTRTCPANKYARASDASPQHPVLRPGFPAGCCSECHSGREGGLSLKAGVQDHGSIRSRNSPAVPGRALRSLLNRPSTAPLTGERPRRRDRTAEQTLTPMSGGGWACRHWHCLTGAPPGSPLERSDRQEASLDNACTRSLVGVPPGPLCEECVHAFPPSPGNGKAFGLFVSKPSSQVAQKVLSRTQLLAFSFRIPAHPSIHSLCVSESGNQNLVVHRVRNDLRPHVVENVGNKLVWEEGRANSLLHPQLKLPKPSVSEGLRCVAPGWCLDFPSTPSSCSVWH